MRAAHALATLVLALAGAPGALAQPVSEYELKAAFIYNFALLTDWPRGAHAVPETSFGVCVIGRNPFGHSLAKLAGRPVDARRIVLRELASASAARDCHVLFIGASGARPVSAIIDSLGEANVLTVAESSGAGASAAAITLFAEDRRVTFAVNLGTVRRARLHVSPRLLRLAVQVIEE